MTYAELKPPFGLGSPFRNIPHYNQYVINILKKNIFDNKKRRTRRRFLLNLAHPSGRFPNFLCMRIAEFACELGLETTTGRINYQSCGFFIVCPSTVHMQSFN